MENFIRCKRLSLARMFRLDAKVAVLEPMLLSENLCLLVFNSDIQFLKSVLIQGRIDLSLGEAPVEYYNRQ